MSKRGPRSDEHRNRWGEAAALQPSSPYKSKDDLSVLLDELRATIPQLLNEHEIEEFWSAFDAKVGVINKAAMGFTLDYVSECIKLLTADLRSGVFGRPVSRERAETDKEDEKS